MTSRVHNVVETTLYRTKDASRCLQLSDEALCLDVISVGKVKARRSEHVVLSRMDATGDIAQRKFVRVHFFGRQQYADIVTGSLYDVESGRCYTGDLQIVSADAKPAKKAKRAPAREVAGWMNESRRVEA